MFSLFVTFGCLCGAKNSRLANFNLNEHNRLRISAPNRDNEHPDITQCFPAAPLVLPVLQDS